MEVCRGAYNVKLNSYLHLKIFIFLWILVMFVSIAFYSNREIFILDNISWFGNRINVPFNESSKVLLENDEDIVSNQSFVSTYSRTLFTNGVKNDCLCKPSTSGLIGRKQNQPNIISGRRLLSEDGDRSCESIPLFMGEFGYEAIAVFPYAYYCYVHGRLNATSSCGDMRPFYYFSPNHTVHANCIRTDSNNVADYMFNGGIHEGSPPKQWLPPPLKKSFCGCPKLWNEWDQHSNMVIISNKYTREWYGNPQNFIDIASLIEIVRYFLDKNFFVIYNRAYELLPSDASQPSLDFPDHSALLREFKSSKLKFMQDIAKDHPELTFNEVQVRTMAKSRCFVSVQGGSSILSSYFGGINTILARVGKEITYDSYDRLYHRFSGSLIRVTNSSQKLIRMCKQVADSGLCRSL